MPGWMLDLVVRGGVKEDVWLWRGCKKRDERECWDLSEHLALTEYTHVSKPRRSGFWRVPGGVPETDHKLRLYNGVPTPQMNFP